jgi:hypothetical protein
MILVLSIYEERGREGGNIKPLVICHGSTLAYTSDIHKDSRELFESIVMLRKIINNEFIH